MWQTKYASAVPIDLGLGFDFRPCSKENFLIGCPQSVIEFNSNNKHRFLPLSSGSFLLYLQNCTSEKKSVCFRQICKTIHMKLQFFGHALVKAFSKIGRYKKSLCSTRRKNCCFMQILCDYFVWTEQNGEQGITHFFFQNYHN